MDSIVFRKAFKGYNKEDVNAYILKISQKVAEKDGEIERLEKENGENKLRREAAETLLTEESGKLEQKEKEIAILKEEIELLKAEAEKNAFDPEPLKKENEELKAKLKDAEDVIAECKKTVEETFEKTKQYDTLSGKLGEVMMKANAQAEAIITDAETRAKQKYDEMLDESKENVSSLNEKYSARIFDRTRDLLKKLDDVVTESAVFKAEIDVSLSEDIENRKNSGGDAQ